jgi:hypothetical protein
MGPEAKFCAKPAVIIRHNITVNIRILFIEMSLAVRYKVNKIIRVKVEGDNRRFLEGMHQWFSNRQ